MRTKEPIRVLIVDDQADARDWLAEWLRVQHGYIVDTAGNSQEAIKYVRAAQGNYDTIVMDQLLTPGPDGIQTMMTIRAKYPNIEIIIITGFGSLEVGIAAMRAGAFRYIFKPLNREELVINIEMAAERHRLKYSLSRREEQLRALQFVGQEINRSLDPVKVQDVILRKALELTGAHFGAIWQWNTEKNALIFSQVRPPVEKLSLAAYPKQIPIPSGIDGCVGVSGRAALNMRTIRVADVTKDPDYIAYILNTRSELAVPLMYGDECIGVLDVQHSEIDAFSEEDQSVLEALAAQAAIAIQNAGQYEELKRTKGLIGARTALAWMGMTSSIWRHAIDNYAVTIREQIQLLGRDLQRSLPREGYDMVEKRLGVIERLTKQILEKPIIPPLSTEEGVALVVVDDLIGERARQLWQNEPYKSATLKLDLRLDNAATVRVSPEWLRRAFDVLVDNAVEALASCEVRKINIGTREVGGGVEIVVSDTGSGMPKEILPQLFQKPIEEPEGAKGLGMGLLMAQAIVQTYGGYIRVESTGPTGTTMVIWLPLAT
jgi:signal transduction histidine kinase